ncbi:hypothetical protein TNCV_3147851 [Trichonephila clavipes]|nr:hypothetical protein TNCV_3147851 [Trichonephila clavipes]
MTPLHSNTVGNWHEKVAFCGVVFCAILFVAVPHQVALRYINFCTVQPIAELPTGSPRMMPTWLYHQHFAMFPLKRHYNLYSTPIAHSQNPIKTLHSRSRGFSLSAYTREGETMARDTITWAPLRSKGDEAHFWLNGYVNKQNCRIWSEANPQVYVETPLHPEKLTVWCALWAGGILLQKR